MPAHGVPCLLAGRGPYSELGFCLVADTPILYESALCGVSRHPKLGEEEQFRAQLYFALNQLFGGLSSFHMVGLNFCNGPIAYWNDLRRSIELYSVEQDPLYRNICDSLAACAPRVLNYELIRFLVAE